MRLLLNAIILFSLTNVLLTHGSEGEQVFTPNGDIITEIKTVSDSNENCSKKHGDGKTESTIKRQYSENEEQEITEV